MTGKADAVRAVSQQFKDRTNTVIEGVMAHLRDDNANEILGPGLSPLIGRGSLKSIVTFALYADVLRMVRDMVMADGEISDEEVQESLGLLSVLAAGFAKVRSKEYSTFAQVSLDNARQFLAQYESDAGLFGHANESTTWVGVQLCRNIQSHCGEPGPLEAFGGSLVAWAEALAGSDGVAASEQAVQGTIRNLVGVLVGSQEHTSEEAEMADGQLLTKEIAENFLNDPESVDLSDFTALEDSAADVLAKSTKCLTLSSLEMLSDAAAKALATHDPKDERSGLSTVTLDIGLNCSDVTLSPQALRVLSFYKGTLAIGVDLSEKRADPKWQEAIALFDSRQDKRLFVAFTDEMESVLEGKDRSDLEASEAVFDWVFETGAGHSCVDVFQWFKNLIEDCGNRTLWWGIGEDSDGNAVYYFATGSEADVLSRMKTLPDK